MIAQESSEATFENTCGQLDRAGGLLTRTQKIFYNLCSSCSGPELQAVQLKLAAPLAAHSLAIYTLPGLFPRIDAIHAKRESLNLSPEQLRLIERLHLDFTRAGAKFSSSDQLRYSDITKRLAELTTMFTQNVIADESEKFIELTDSDITSLPEFLQKAAKQAAEERGKTDKFVITLSRSLVVPFLQFSDRRDLREKAWRMWTMRGELDENRDNLALAKEILILRSEQAKMHGYKTYADYATADTMAGTPAAVSELLERVWGPAKESADRERTALQEFIQEASGDIERPFQVKIEPWDWRFYAEKVRNTKYNLDEVTRT